MPDALSTPKLPASGLLLAAQIRYQVRLLLANGRTAVLCIGLPVILLATSGISHGHASAAAVAGPATFGLTLASWNARGVRLVAAREAGVLKRWRAAPLSRWCYFFGRVIATVAAGAVTVAVSVCCYHVHFTAGLPSSCSSPSFLAPPPSPRSAGSRTVRPGVVRPAAGEGSASRGER